MSDKKYIVQSRLPGWDQRSLERGTALVIGVGGLGLPAALYLAAMGIGALILADPDTVAEENLHRQPLYTPHDIGRPKVEVLADHLSRLRPDIRLSLYPLWVEERFLREIGIEADIWIDGTDNLESRLCIDKMAQELRKPWVYGAIFQWEGQVGLLERASYQEIFGTGLEAPSCTEAGVIGALPGIIGSWQAALAAQYLADPWGVPRNRLFRVDLRRGESHTFWLPASPLPALDLTSAEVRCLPNPYWIDVREEATPLPFPAEKKSPYIWEEWTLPAQPVIIICETGNRSRQIAYALRRRTGRGDIYSLRGGAALLR
ncbi:MAG: HesA/MoeB/ThiF family protein [Bacteroidia bacterium]|nr:HesA/MoeB/ThiF family protein [Bacteroidia bacterium]MDW8014466.1 HesA/MoeB/ThiF family protein [Bacteroidia bacterium]